MLHDAQIRRRFELLDEAAALLAPALVENDRRDVLRVHVDDTEDDHLKDGNGQREQQCPAITNELRQLLAKDGDETVHRRAPASAARRASISRPRVSVRRTNTSSSVGSISFTTTSVVPNASRSRSSFSFDTLSSMRRCSAVPKMVTA